MVWGMRSIRAVWPSRKEAQVSTEGDHGGSHRGGVTVRDRSAAQLDKMEDQDMSDKTNWRILVTDIAWPSVEPEAEVLARVGGELVLAESGSEEELLSLVPEADAILTCWNQVPASVVRAGHKLQVIGRYGIGVDNIAVEEATKRGIL